MSVLGTLTLDLSAPTAQLSRDLDRAQQLAREAASKMGGIKPVWGIASSLQDEMRASRSILNSSLKAIESDTKGYRPMVRVGVDFDGGAIDTQMQSLEREFSQRSAYLNRQVITPQVDDSQLTALNKHLSVKERHLDTVVAKFANTRITPSVSADGFERLDRSLDTLNRRIAQTRSAMAIPIEVPGLDGTTRDMRVRMVIDDRQLRQRITVNLDINGNELSRSVEDSIKKGFKGVKASGGNLIDVVTSVPKTIFRGFQEGIGLTYAQSLTKGTIKGLEEQFGASLDRVGQSIGNRAGQVGKNVGNGLIQRAGFGGTEDVKAKLSELNEAFVDLFPTGILEKKLQKIESRLMKIIDNMTRMRPFEEQVQGVQGFAGAIGELSEVPKQGLKNRRAKQVKKYAEQVKNSGTGEKVDIADDVHTIIIATGGFAGQKGKSSGMVGKKLQSLMGDGYHVVSVDNTNTDVSMPLQEAGVPRWLAEGGGKIAKNKLVDGINPDAVTMATLAHQLQQQYPGKKIKFAGFSSGGIVANDATELYQATGKQAEGVAIGSPIFNNAANEKAGTFSAVLRKEDGVNKVAKKIEQVTGIGLNKKVTTMTEGAGHELALYLSDPKSQRVILDRLGNKNEPLRNKSAADFDVINYKHQAEQSLEDLGYQLANPIKDPKTNRILLEQKLAGIKETRASIKQSLPNVHEGKAELVEYLQALNEANALLNRVLKLESIPIIGTPEPKQSRRLSRSPIDTEPTDDPWSDNYRPPQLEQKGSVAEAAEMVAERRRNRKNQVSNASAEVFEFVNAPSLGIKNTSSGDTDKLSSAIDKFDRAVDKFTNNQKKESKRSTKKDEVVDGEYVEQSNGSKMLSATRQGLNLASQPIGKIGSVASGAEKALFEALPILKPLKGAMQIGGTLAIGGAISQNPVGQAAIAGTSHVMQSIAGAPISQFAGMTSSAIEQILGSALAHLPGGTGLAQSIAVEVQRALQSGGAQAAGAIVSVLSPYLVAKLGMGAAGAGIKQLMPGLAGDERVTASTQRNLMGAGRAVRQLMPVTTIEPFWDVEATVVEDLQLPQGKKNKALPPSKSIKPSKSFNPAWPRIVEESLKETQSQLEQAIKNGELDLAKQYHARLKEQVAGAHKLVNVGLSSDKLSDADKQHLASSVRGNLTKKSKYLASSGEAIETMEFSDANPSDVKGKIGWSEKLKRSVAQGIRRNMGHTNNDAGFINLGARIPALDFLDTPVQSFKNTVDRLNPFKPRQQQSLRISDYAPTQYAPTQLDALLRAGRVPTYTPNLNPLIYTESFAPNPNARTRLPVNPRIAPIIASQPIIPDASEKSETALSKLVGVGKLALGVFGGFTALSLGVPAMISLGKSVFDTAANFERLQVKMASASDSAQSGKQKFAQLSATADNLGISRSSALETGAYIGGTTFGTQLDGAPSDAITKQILQVAQARGLNKQETDGLNLAIGQTLGRSRTSAQEINQLTQSAGITDARAIAARGLGMTAAQFSQVQDSPTGIDSKRFVQAFLTQAVQDSQSGKALAQDSVGFKQGQLGAAAERTAGNLGAPMMPVVKLALDGLNSALKLFNDGLERSSGLLMGLALGGIAAIGIQALTSGTVLNVVMGMTGNAIRQVGVAAFSTLPSMAVMGKALAGMTAYAVGFALAGELIRQGLEILKNQSQDLADDAFKIGEATRESEKEKSKPKEGEKQTTGEIGGRDWGESAILALQRADRKVGEGLRIVGLPGYLSVDNKEKESNDRKIAAGEIIIASNQQMLKTDAAIQSAKSVTQIDLDLARIDTERSGLFSGGNPDGTKLAAIDAEYQKKTSERQKVIDNITPQKTDLQNAINANRGGVAKLNKELADGQITRPEYDEQLKTYNNTIKSLELNMRNLNAVIRSSFDNLQPWLTTLSTIVAKFEDIGVAANTSRERFAISRNAGEIGSRLTRGGSERQAVYDNDRITSEEIKARKAVINELKGSLGNLDRNNIATVQKAYGLTDASSSAQIKIAAGNATSVNDKTTLEKLATIKEEQIKVATLDATLSNSHAETYRRIFDENREAALYYTSLSQQIDPKGVMFAKNISAITAEKARFMAKLQNYGTGGFDVYTTAIIDLMDLAKDRMTALAKLAADKKAAIDAQTNRNNDIAGKRQNDFDTSPFTQQPSVGKVSGVAQNGNTNVPEVGSTQSQSVNTSSPAIQSVETPLPPKTIKVNRTKTFVDANGYTDSPNPRIQAQIRAQLANGGHSPSNVNRYVNTTQAIGSRTYDSKGNPNGYTDLGLDEFDRKILGLNDRGKPQGIPISTVTGKPLRSPFSQIDSKPVAGSNRSGKPQGSKIIVQYEDEIPNPEYQRAVNTRNKRKSAINAPQPAANQVTPQYIGGRLTTGQFRDKSQVASDRIYQEAIDRANATFSEFEPTEKLRQTKAMQDVERNGRLAQQAANKFKRDQDSTQLNATPAISIQDTQNRETLQQRNSLIDNRENVTNQRIDMESQIKNIEVSIQVLADLEAKKNRTPADEEMIKKLKIAVPTLVKQLPQLNAILGRLKTSEANLPANDAKAIAALEANQKYQREVSKEREEQDRRAAEISQDRTKLTDIDQKLVNAPLDQDKLKEQWEINKQLIIKQAKITRVEEDRKVTERERSDSTFYPKLAEAARKRNREIEENTIKNAENKQAQESVRAANTVKEKTEVNRQAELGLQQSSGDLQLKSQQSQDKIDAPFANTKALEIELQQKLSAIDKAKIARDEAFRKARVEFNGDSQFNKEQLASIDRQQLEADRQSQIEKTIAETESGIAIRGVQKDRRGYLDSQSKAKFTQSSAIYDAQTTGDKQRGVDTRDREYISAVRKRRNEADNQIFDLQQQRSQIVGEGKDAQQAREHIDGLIAGIKELAAIDLSNMANQFDRFNQILGETQKTTQSVLEKFVKTGKFDWKSILRTPLEGGISQIMGKIVPDLFSGLYRKNPVPETQSQPTSFVRDQPVEPLAPAPVIPAPSAKVERAAEQIINQPSQAAIAPVASRSILDAQGMANVPMPGGGNYRIPREQAISDGFMRLDGSSTSVPEVKPEVKIAPMEPQTIAAPEVTIEPIAPQTIPAPTDDNGFDIRQLPLKGRSNIVNFKPKFDPNAVIAPPMPVSPLEGKPDYTGATSQQRVSFSSGDAMSLASLIPGTGGAGKYMGLLGKLGGLFGLGFADGGMVPSDSKFGEFRQGNDPIGAALRKEGHNSVIAALTPGERVLTVSESRYYETIFPQGIKGYADGGVVGNIKPIPLNLDQSKIDNRGDSNEFNFDIKNGGGGENGKMTKDNLKEMENAVVAVLLKQKRARTGLVPM